MNITVTKQSSKTIYWGGDLTAVEFLPILGAGFYFSHCQHK